MDSPLSAISDHQLGASPSDMPARLAAALAERYVLERELGRGGMATVYLAEDVRHHRQVALKVLHPELGAVLGADRFLREIGIAARLNHPHILPLHDSGTLDLGLGRPVLFYAMPYVAGRSLRERLREELQLPIDEAIGIARQVADALDHAHRQGVIHRDIKPENILLADGEAVLADFGIARALDVAGGDRLTETGLALGTPAYMSPEQSAGTTRLDGRSDTYALGCVLYEMLGGQPPFSGPSPQAILARHAIDPVPSLRTLRPTVPRGLGQVVSRSLAKVPADRFPTARAFAEALTQTSAAPIGSGDDTPATVLEARRVAGRRRWVLAGVVGALVVAGGLAAALARKPVELSASRVLVLPFQNRTGDSTLGAMGDIAADYIVGGLRGTHDVDEVVDARSQGDGSAAARLGRSGARAVARDAQAGTIVLGSYDRAPGDSLQFQAEVLDTKSGRTLRVVGPVTAPANNRLTALGDVRSRVMAGVATVVDPEFWGNAHSFPATYQAYQAYKAGIDVLDHCGGDAACRDRGFKHYFRAAALDSNFTMPLAEIAFRSMWDNCALVDSLALALRPRLEGLPPEDRVQLQVATYRCHGNMDAALDAAAGTSSNTPKSERLLMWKARLFLDVNRPRAAADVLERFDVTRAMDPPGYLSTLLRAYHDLGLYDKALAYVARVSRLELGTNADLRGFFFKVEIKSLAALGRVADIRTKLDEAAKQLGAAWSGLVVFYMIEEAGQELAAHGHPAEAQAMYERALAWAKSQSTEQQATPDARRAMAEVLNAAGRWDDARRLYQGLTATDSNDTYLQATLGNLAARRGDRAEADRIDRWLAARGRKDPGGAGSKSWTLYFRARIAGLLGDHQRAMGLLREAAQLGFDGWRDAHVDPDLVPLRADPAFQEWIRPKD
jgi:tetratricopeptide (TPR) repeat protein